MERRAIGLVGLAMCAGLFLLTTRLQDVTPVRDGLDSAAAKVCAEAPVRPVDARAARFVGAFELETTLVTLCTEASMGGGLVEDVCSLTSAPSATCRHVLANADPYLDTVHEALRQDRAIIGVMRRGRVVMNRGDWAHCVPAWPRLEHLMLASVQKLEAAGDLDGALARCADVYALARDVAFAGSVGDVADVIERIEPASQICGSVVDAASHEQASDFAISLDAIWRAFPSSVANNDALLKAELDLYQFGYARDRSRGLRCAAADELARMDDARHPRLDFEGRRRARAMWDAQVRWTNPGLPKASAAYWKLLASVDGMRQRANAR